MLQGTKFFNRSVITVLSDFTEFYNISTLFGLLRAPAFFWDERVIICLV